jgi:DNA-binding transcriptional MerR regulator
MIRKRAVIDRACRRNGCANAGSMALIEIPDKLFFKISEVCQIVGVEPYVLRFWETEFPSFAPEKSKAGHRVYKKKDVENVLRIKELLYDRGFTIAGARKHLSKASRPSKADRADVLQRIRKDLQDILTLLRRKT